MAMKFGEAERIGVDHNVYFIMILLAGSLANVSMLLPCLPILLPRHSSYSPSCAFTSGVCCIITARAFAPTP